MMELASLDTIVEEPEAEEKDKACATNGYRASPYPNGIS